MPGVEGVDPSPTEIEAIKNEVIKVVEEYGLENIIQDDLTRLKSNDDYIKRSFKHVFDLHGRQVDEAVNMIVETFKWRKKFGVDKINIDTINKEFFEKGALYTHNRDKDGKLLFIYEVRNHVKGVHNMDELKNFFIYLMEKIDKEEEGEMKFTLLFNCYGSGLKNVDMVFIPWIINCFKFYYPYMVNYILVLDIPMIMNAAWVVVKNLLPRHQQRQVNFVTRRNIAEFLDKCKYLEAWGGSDTWTYSPRAEMKVATASKWTSQSRQLECNSASSVARTHLNNSVPCEDLAQKESEASPGRISKDEQSSPLLIEPAELFVFSVRPKGNWKASIKVTNQSCTPMAFKMKATSAERYRTKISSGIIAAGETIILETEVMGDIGRVGRDKFLLTGKYVKKEYIPHSQLQDILRTGKLDLKHKIGCVLAQDQLINVDEIHKMADYDILNENIEKLESLCEELTAKMEKNTWTENLIALLVVSLLSLLLLWI